MFRIKHNGVYLILFLKNLFGFIKSVWYPEVQEECYRGANFNHFRIMVTDYKGNSQPANIVLNISINKN